MAATLWYVEDDGVIADLVRERLQAEGYGVRIFPCGLELRNALRGPGPDLVMIDWTLPDDDGVALCRRLRQGDARLPIMMVTVRDEPQDIVKALRSGADDYVTKPFVTEVLLSRIEALLRRADPASQPLTCGAIRLDGQGDRAFVGDEPVHLSPLEYRLLLLLMQNKGRIVARELIRQSLWEAEGRCVSDNALTVTMRRLRAKLGSEGRLLKTVRSFGYRMEEPL